ncbi:MAG: hypothetical protein AAGJ74_13580 [Pseudomonadota bacterium]
MGDKAETADALDPKGVIADSYRIAGISEPECRSIFLDWAMSVPQGAEARDLVRALLDIYAPDAPDHPMTTVLRAALEPAAQTGRRGGRAARVQG